MKKILPFILAALIIFGGTAFWKYSGAGSAVEAQKEVRENGFYYEGDTWMSPDAFDELKISLSRRDSSLQTSSDLVILPEIRDGELHIKYSFFSVENYDGLNGTRDFPTTFRVGLALIPTVGFVLFFGALLVWAFKVLMRGQGKESSA